MTKNHHIWTEKYRPKKISEYVFKDVRMRSWIESCIQEKNIPHLLFYGPAGTGKSSMVNVLLHELEVNPGDILYMNASEERSINDIREKVLRFVPTLAYGDFKVVVLEEGDAISIDGMNSLKRILEDYADNVRFIITTNHIQKIIPPLRSRCQEVHIDRLDPDDFQYRIATVLQEENVDVNEETLELLDAYIKACYPDMRKTLNTLQQNVVNNKLNPPSGDEQSSSEFMVKVVELFKQGRITEARKLACSSIRPDEYEDFYRFMYRNLELFGKTDLAQSQALILIRNALVNHTIVADPEINLAACLVEISMIQE